MNSDEQDLSNSDGEHRKNTLLDFNESSDSAIRTHREDDSWNDTDDEDHASALISGNNSDGLSQQANSQWSDLPSLPVENIYSFLSRTDQCRMSLVCQRWSKDYGSPSIWKTIKFYLPEVEYPAEIYPEVRFARKYGSMFRNVEIICKTIKNQLLGAIFKQVRLFLLSLTTNSQLNSVKFVNLGHYFSFLDDFIRDDVFKAILNFLTSQGKLQVVEFTDCNFHVVESVTLLRALIKRSNTIRQLTLRGFVNESSAAFTGYELFNKETYKFSIQRLEIDYTLLFENLLTYVSHTFDEHQTDALNNNSNSSKVDKFPLSKLSIYCEGIRHAHYTGLSPSVWQKMVKLSPDLRVELDLTSHTNVRLEMTKFIVKYMPLRSLDFRFLKHYATPRIGLAEFFDHLLTCRCNYSLEVVNVVWMPLIHDLASTLTPFLLACKRLQTFHLHGRYLPTGIDTLFESLMERRPVSLRSITLWFNFVKSQREEDILKALSEEYYPQLKLMDIEMFLVLDPGRRPRPGP